MTPTSKWTAALTAALLLAPPGPAGIDRATKPPEGSARQLGSTPSGSTSTSTTPKPRQTVHQPPRASRNRTPSQAIALTRKMAKTAGLNLHQRQCLERLWTRESNFRPDALNRRSGAGGIPQILGLDPSTPTAHQIRRGLAYISHRYGTPCTALRHHLRRGWY